MHHQQELDARDLRHRREVGERIERRLGEIRVDREDVVGREQPGVAVGRALRDQVGADVLAAAGAVLDHHRLRPDPCRPCAMRAGDGVGRAARRQRHDDPDRPLRESPAPCEQRSKSDSQTQPATSVIGFLLDCCDASLPIAAAGEYDGRSQRRNAHHADPGRAGAARKAPRRCSRRRSPCSARRATSTCRSPQTAQQKEFEARVKEIGARAREEARHDAAQVLQDRRRHGRRLRRDERGLREERASRSSRC